MWLSSEGSEETDAVCGSSLSAKLHVCDRQLGQFPCQTRSCSWQVTFKVDKNQSRVLTIIINRKNLNDLLSTCNCNFPNEWNSKIKT